MRKIIHIFLSLVIVYASTTSAYANTSIGGWTALDTITAGATNTINATKTAGGKVLNSAITIVPQASKVGKHLIKGGGSAALAFAMVELADGAIDWVLDPANNQVIINKQYSGEDLSIYEQMCIQYINTHYADADLRNLYLNSGLRVIKYANTSTARCVSYPFGAITTVIEYPIGGDSGQETLPIATVAAKVVSNAVAGHAPSQEAVKAVALEGFAAGEHDAALEAAATEVGTANPPDTTDPENPTEPADIISAINALKALLAGILSSITGLSDFFNSEPPPEKTQEETDVPVDDLPPTKGASDFDVNYINFGGQCPVLPSFDVGIGGASSTLTFDMTPLCDMAVKIRPAVIAIAYFIGLGVIASAIRET